MHLGHHRNGHGGHDFADHFDRGHARHAALFANIRRHALQRHHRARAGVFGDLGLLGVGDVHDHAALEHLGQADFHAPLIRSLCSVATPIHFLRVHFTSPLAPVSSRWSLSVKSFLLFYFCPMITNRALLRASTVPAVSRISLVMKMFLPFCSVSRPSTSISFVTSTGFKYSTVNSAVTARTSRNRQTLPIASSKSTAIIPPCANPAPPSYRSPRTNRPTIRRFTLSCSNVSFIPPALSPPQPKHLFFGLGSSRTMSVKLFPRSPFLASLFQFLTLTPHGCAPPFALRVAACAFQSSAVPLAWPRPAQSAFHPGSQTRAAACSAAAPAHRNNAPAQKARRVPSRGSTIRWHRILVGAPATSTFRLPAASSAFLQAYAFATLRPMPPSARCRPCASWRGAW